eukprot:326235-Chlamydomonas_euryale.AAC.1
MKPAQEHRTAWREGGPAQEHRTAVRTCIGRAKAHQVAGEHGKGLAQGRMHGMETQPPGGVGSLGSLSERTSSICLHVVRRQRRSLALLTLGTTATG